MLRNEAMAKKSLCGPAILARSALMERILTNDGDDLMPPPDSHKTLSARQKDILKLWIAQGAEYQSHWSFMPLAGGADAGGEASRLAAQTASTVHSRTTRSEGLAPSPVAGEGDH